MHDIPPLLPKSVTSGIKIDRVLIVRLGAMGDVLHALPPASALRQAFPSAQIGWVIEERWAELLCSRDTPRCGPRLAQRPLVDRVHWVNTRAWRNALFSDATWSAVVSAIKELRAERYDVAIDFQGAVRSALLARFSGAPQIFGFAQPRENAASMFYTRQVHSRNAHVVDQNLSLLRAVTRTPPDRISAELPRDPFVESSILKKLKSLAIGSYAILNPGAGWGAKQWPAERYGQTARLLAERAGLTSLVNCGPGEEALASEVEETAGGAAQAISTSISELIALTRHATLFIGGDTGPMHMAAILGVPVVAIFGPTNPARNGPYGTRSIVLRNAASITSHARHPRPDAAMLEIGAPEVVDAAVKLLGATRA
jgi:heptosyltransferase I